jgi:hypothetical protein
MTITIKNPISVSGLARMMRMNPRTEGAMAFDHLRIVPGAGPLLDANEPGCDPPAI